MRALSARLIPALVAVTLLPAAVHAQDAKADILPITTARIDQLVKGLEAEYAVWKPAFDRDQKKIQAAEAAGGGGASGMPGSGARERWRSCVEPILGADTAAMRISRVMMERFTTMKPDAQTALGTRMNRYEQRVDELGPNGDPALVRLYKDSVRAAIFEVTGISVAEQTRAETRVMTAVEKKCGKEPASPDRDASDESAQGSHPEQLETDTLVSEVGLRATGLRPRAYTILRERVAAYVLTKTGDGELGDYVFTAAEKAALDQRMSGLRKFAEMLSSTGHWQFD